MPDHPPTCASAEAKGSWEGGRLAGTSSWLGGRVPFGVPRYCRLRLTLTFSALTSTSRESMVGPWLRVVRRMNWRAVPPLSPDLCGQRCRKGLGT